MRSGVITLKNLFISLSLFSLLSGCVMEIDLSSLPGLSKSRDAGGGDDTIIEPIKENEALGPLMAVIAQGKCVNCHSAGAASGGTNFADLDEVTSYTGILKLVNMTNPSDSRIIAKSQDSHFGSAGVLLNRAVWEERVIAFVEGEKKLDPGGTDPGPTNSPSPEPVSGIPEPIFMSSAMTINNSNTQVVRSVIPVRGVSGIPSGLSINLEITPFVSTGNTVLMRFVVSVANTTNIPITVTGFRLFQGSGSRIDHERDYINSRGGSYFKVSQTIAAGMTFTYNQPVSRLELLTTKGSSSGLTIAVGFQSVVAETGHGGNYGGVAGKCLGCHGPNSSRGFKVLDDPTASCLNLVNYTNTNPTSASVLLQKARLGNNHGGGVRMDATDESFFVDWVNLFR
jgi:mono/diheme cytochrome c family protein